MQAGEAARKWGDRMRLIDADALERDGWQMTRNVRVAKDTMEFQTRKPTDFPTIEPKRMRGIWTKEEFTNTQGTSYGAYKCSLCGAFYQDIGYEWNFCPNCGADMRGTE